MKIQIFDTYEEMSRAGAELIAAQLLLKPDSHIGLTAGKTPVGMFAELVKLYENSNLSFARCHLYNLEEMYGIEATDPASCRSYFHRNFLDRVDASDEQLILPDGMAKDIDEESAAYNRILEELPGGQLDMQILGIGEDAHIGMNRPAEELCRDCHPAKSAKGRMAVAMGVGNILLAKNIILLANGEQKAQAVADMVNRGISSAAPATLLQLHPKVTVLLDKGAASRL